MTLNIKTNHYLVQLVAVLMLIVMLGGCSSGKPSPWAQQGSPWGETPKPAAEEEPASPWVEEAAVIEEAVVEPEPAPIIEESVPMMQSVAGDIMTQPADYFVVQLCASSTMDKLLKFARRYNLPEQWTTQTNVQGKTWYILMQGVYPTRTEAESALSFVRGQGLPTKPWIRSVASVQAVAR